MQSRLSYVSVAALIGMMAASAAGASQAQDATAKASTPDTGTTVNELVVTARRLNEARASIQPQIGASVYTIDEKAIQAMPGGDNVQLNQVVLQSPGVAQDSYGQLHVRGEHNGLQFRINGVILPEGLSVFGQALSPRLAEKVELITGALPAEYGLRTAGIIDVTTKNGIFANAGQVSLYGGSHAEIEPSLEYGGHSGNLNYFVSASYLRNDLGIESPDGRSTPLHDHTDQVQAFAYLEDIVDSVSKISVVLGASNQRFQIPNQAGQTAGLMYGSNGDQPLMVNGQVHFQSETLNESQKEATYFGTASYLRTTDRFTGQFSLFARFSSLMFVPDPLGDLLFTGLSESAYKKDVAGGVQAEGVYRLTPAHTLRGAPSWRSTDRPAPPLPSSSPWTRSETRPAIDRPPSSIMAGGPRRPTAPIYRTSGNF